MRQLVRALVPLLLIVAACAQPQGAFHSTTPEHMGIAFPDTIDEFIRVRFEEFDDSRFGAFANYRVSLGDPLIISVYVYPAPRFPDGSMQTLPDHARDELVGLLQHFENSKQIDWPADLEDFMGEGLGGYVAAIEYQDAELDTTRSFLHLFGDGERRLKLRTSYPADHPKAHLLLPDFLESLRQQLFE